MRQTSLNQLKQVISKSIQATVKRIYAVSLPPDTFALEAPPDSAMGDFAFPCFHLAKALKKAPAHIASELAEKLRCPPGVSHSVAVGPYLNFFVSPQTLANLALQKKQKTKKTSQKTIIEYVSPNTNKPLHLGHVRNAVLGDSVSRLLSASGVAVKKTCLVNDRGIHICKSMTAYFKQHGVKGPTPSSTGLKGDHFVGNYYVLFEKILQKHPALMDEAQECLKKWEAGDRITRTLWKKMNAWVLSGMGKTYKRLGVAFDKTYYESDISDKGRDIILSQLKKGTVKRDETGAVYADLSSFNLPNKILLRKDGTTLYITQDIYLAVQKWKDYHASTSVYVVGSEQNLYLAQLFSVLGLFGYAWATNLIHLSYGMVNLPEGKMKSREGTVVDADDLLNELEELAQKEIKRRDAKLPASEQGKRARAIALSALKFYMLVVSPKSDMTFNPKESIAFQGRTGPYLLYTYARLRSIARKSGKGKRPPKNTAYGWEAEKQLCLHLATYGETICRAAKNYDPSLVANYLYALCQMANDYYHNVPVLSASDLERHSRLLLIDRIAQTLQGGLGLLGISTIEQM